MNEYDPFEAVAARELAALQEAYATECSAPEADELWRAASQDVRDRANKEQEGLGASLSYDDLLAARAEGLRRFIEWEQEQRGQK